MRSRRRIASPTRRSPSIRTTCTSATTPIGARNFPSPPSACPDYAQPLASLTAFGFQYDAAFVQATGGHWKGLDAAEAQVERQALAQGIPVTRYRAMLQHRYSDILGVAAVSEGGAKMS